MKFIRFRHHLQVFKMSLESAHKLRHIAQLLSNYFHQHWNHLLQRWLKSFCWIWCLHPPSRSLDTLSEIKSRQFEHQNLRICTNLVCWNAGPESTLECKSTVRLVSLTYQQHEPTFPQYYIFSDLKPSVKTSWRFWAKAPLDEESFLWLTNALVTLTFERSS